MTIVTDSRFCSFTLAGYFFGVEVERVQEVLRHQPMTRIPLAPPQVRGLINLRGQIVTAIDLRRLFGFPDRPMDELPMNVVVRGSGGAVSLLVDEIDEVLDPDSDSFELPPQNLNADVRRLVRGVHKFDRRLMLVLDVDQVLRGKGSASGQASED